MLIVLFGEPVQAMAGVDKDVGLRTSTKLLRALM